MRRGEADRDFVGYDDSLDHLPQQQWLKALSGGRPLALQSYDLSTLLTAVRADRYRPSVDMRWCEPNELVAMASHRLCVRRRVFRAPIGPTRRHGPVSTDRQLIVILAAFTISAKVFRLLRM